MSGISQSILQLALFRGLQGLGAGGLITGTQAIVGDVVPPRQRGKYQGLFAAVFGLASVSGPLLGGYFTDSLTWRWVFYVNIPIGVVALAVLATTLHLPKKRSEHKVDYLGAGILSLGISSLILLTTWGGNTYSWLSPEIIGMSVLTLLAGVAFVFVEKRAAEPIIPLPLFKIESATSLLVLSVFVGFGMFGAISFLPLFLQTVFSSSPIKSGLQLLTLTAGFLFSSTLSGQLITKTGKYKKFPIIGAFLGTIGMFLFSTLSKSTSFYEFGLYAFIFGAGVGTMLTAPVIAIQNSAPKEMLGTATSSIAFFRSIGGSLGVALFGSIFSSRLAYNLKKNLPHTVAHKLGTGIGSFNPSALNSLPSAIHNIIIDAFANSLDVVFLVCIPFLAINILLASIVKEKTLANEISASPALE